MHEDGETVIVVLPRGWVAVGTWNNDGRYVRLTDSRIIRRWGTSEGLGELVNGPLSGTTLDKGGELRFSEMAVVLTFVCNLEGWADALARPLSAAN